ncbi:MAG: hypothetical protein WB507_05125 [Solirubrobacterales bacterium]
MLSVDPRFEYETEGKTHNLISFLPIPPESSRIALHRIGTHAFFDLNNEGGGLGYLQVRNDVFIVAKDSMAGIGGVLSKVANELAPGGK